MSGSVNPMAILLNGNKTVTATFVQNSYTLTVNLWEWLGYSEQYWSLQFWRCCSFDCCSCVLVGVSVVGVVTCLVQLIHGYSS